MSRRPSSQTAAYLAGHALARLAAPAVVALASTCLLLAVAIGG